MTLSVFTPTRRPGAPGPLPLFAWKVPAGFPSPAEDYAQGRLDLNDYLVEHEAATFYVRVEGHSMTGAGILDGDIIAVDRSLEPRQGDVVVAVIDGALTVKELNRQGDTITLRARNPEFKPIEFKLGQELVIWGVVKGVVRKLR
ncbi:MAG: translesion error-prone DNA polymerase V autoproteolytic subunit [Hydrogenophilales bacterium]|nr:translesion error-prone DNA polymerase V autoproteolytic subunit [Hydrogenophilales bacterium]